MRKLRLEPEKNKSSNPFSMHVTFKKVTVTEKNNVGRRPRFPQEETKNTTNT